MKNSFSHVGRKKFGKKNQIKYKNKYTEKIFEKPVS